MGGGDFRDQCTNERAGVISEKGAVSFVFLRPRLRVVVREFRPQIQLNWSWRVQLRAFESLIAERQRLVKRIEGGLQIRELRERETLMAHISTKLQRVERTERDHSSRETALASARPARPSDEPMVALRKSIPLPVVASAVAPAIQSAPVASAPKPPDIGRLAQQVIQNLDHQARSWRERRGRI